MDALGTCSVCDATWALPVVPCPCGCGGSKTATPQFSRLIITVPPNGKLTWQCPDCESVFTA